MPLRCKTATSGRRRAGATIGRGFPSDDWPVAAQLVQTVGPHGHRNAARSGLAAVDPNGAGRARFGHRRPQRRRQNAGVAPDAAVDLAQEAKIPVFTVGLGSDRQPTQRCRLRSGRARPGVSRRSLHGDRLRAGPRHGGKSRHGATARAARRPAEARARSAAPER